MKITSRVLKEGIVVMEIEGIISMRNDCPQIDEEVEQHIQRNENRVIFDLTGVNYIESAVLGQIVKSHSSLRRAGGGLRLAGVSTMVYGVLKMTRLDRVIEIYPTALDASENFFPQP
jgi:anti-sigma B factor antagonist